MGRNLLILVLAFSFATNLSLQLSLEERQAFDGPDSVMNVQDLESDYLEKPEWSLEERAAAVKHKSGIIRVMEKVVDVMQRILALADGHGSIDEVVSGVQQTFTAVQQLVNVRAIISEVPFIGKTVAWVMSPILDLLGNMVNNTPVFGGLLKQMIVGPTYPVEPPPTPPPPPPTPKPKTTAKPWGWG